MSHHRTPHNQTTLTLHPKALSSGCHPRHSRGSRRGPKGRSVCQHNSYLFIHTRIYPWDPRVARGTFGVPGGREVPRVPGDLGIGRPGDHWWSCGDPEEARPARGSQGDLQNFKIWSYNILRWAKVQNVYVGNVAWGKMSKIF